MIGMLAGRVAFVQYRLMLVYSLRDDPMMAQLTMKNVVLLTSILILTYGLYVPKSWRRAALVVGPLALLPFATLLVLYLRHPEAMAWLGRGWRRSTTPRVWLFSFDAMILLILAVGSAFGARTISRLRRQVAEARQLGQYRLRRRIGAGGMGEVYLAEHQLLKRPCAVKLIRPGDVADPKALERFEREVRLTATLSHPNTVEIYDYGRAEDGTYYYVMEYLPGLSLAELVERHGPLPPARAVYLLRQVCGALREAHAAGLIHRDIKPSNIFAARRGGMDDVAKLLDFGLVRPAATARAAHLSEEGQILGTPLFMSPEQATGGRELDERSDIYSLGAVAYYLLTGRPPFDEDGRDRGADRARPRPGGAAVAGRPGIPEDLERVVLRCLAKDPAERFPDAEALERALGECACAGDWDRERAARWWRDADPCPGDIRLIPPSENRARRDVRNRGTKWKSGAHRGRGGQRGDARDRDQRSARHGHGDERGNAQHGRCGRCRPIHRGPRRGRWPTRPGHDGRDGVQGHAGAPDHGDRVAPRRAIVVTVDQLAADVLQARRGRPVDRELDRFAEGERLPGSERDRVVRRVEDRRAQPDRGRVPGGERPLAVRRRQQIVRHVIRLGGVDRTAQVDDDPGHLVLPVLHVLDAGHGHRRRRCRGRRGCGRWCRCRRGRRRRCGCHDELMAGVAEWALRVDERGLHRRIREEDGIAVERRGRIRGREREIQRAPRLHVIRRTVRDELDGEAIAGAHVGDVGRPAGGRADGDRPGGEEILAGDPGEPERADAGVARAGIRQRDRVVEVGASGRRADDSAGIDRRHEARPSRHSNPTNRSAGTGDPSGRRRAPVHPGPAVTARRSKIVT